MNEKPLPSVTSRLSVVCRVPKFLALTTPCKTRLEFEPQTGSHPCPIGTHTHTHTHTHAHTHLYISFFFFSLLFPLLISWLDLVDVTQHPGQVTGDTAILPS